MLGLTLECARCHDHKFDPITQRDYYSLFAFFNNIDESGLYSHFTSATPSPSLLLWPPAKEEEHRRLTTTDAGARGGTPRVGAHRALSVQGQAEGRRHRRARADRPPDVRRRDRRADAGRRAGTTARQLSDGPRCPTARCDSAATMGSSTRRSPVRPHRSVLAGAPASARPNTRSAPSSCTSPARGRMPAAAASS